MHVVCNACNANSVIGYEAKTRAFQNACRASGTCGTSPGTSKLVYCYLCCLYSSWTRHMESILLEKLQQKNIFLIPEWTMP